MTTFYVIRQHYPRSPTYLSNLKPFDPKPWDARIEAAIHFPTSNAALNAAQALHLRGYTIITRTV